MDYMSHEPQLQTNTVLMVRVSSGHPDLGGGGVTSLYHCFCCLLDLM